MHIAFALFADAANLSQEGKLNILGVFDTLHVGALPTLHPRATLVVRVKGSTADVGMHVLGMSWINPSGQATGSANSSAWTVNSVSISKPSDSTGNDFTKRRENTR